MALPQPVPAAKPGTPLLPLLPPRPPVAAAYDEFLAVQLAKYGRGTVEDAMVRQAAAARNKWLESITVRLPAHMEWRIMVMLLDKPLQQVEMVSQLPVSDRSEVLDILKRMQADRLVRKTGPGNRLSRYELAQDARSACFEPRFDEVCSAAEIEGLTRRVFNGYLKKAMFVAVASQKVTKGRDRTDLVAYDYEDDAPISVEIESVVEVQSRGFLVPTILESMPDNGIMERRYGPRDRLETGAGMDSVDPIAILGYLNDPNEAAPGSGGPLTRTESEFLRGYGLVLDGYRTFRSVTLSASRDAKRMRRRRRRRRRPPPPEDPRTGRACTGRTLQS